MTLLLLFIFLWPPLTPLAPLLGPKSAWPTFAMLAKVMGWMEEEEGGKDTSILGECSH